MLGYYLNLQRDDGSAWEWYAEVVDKNTPRSRRRNNVLELYEQALLTNRDNPKIERHCVDVAMEPGVENYGIVSD